MIPHHRRFSDIADLSHTTEYRKRQKLDNKHFDQMIQSISAVNRDRRQRKASSDAYSPSKSTSELSFIKRKTPSLLSSTSKESSSSSSRHACNPLPQWLVNTFMTLSKKNPLRHLLPPDAITCEGSGVPHTQIETTAQPMEVSATGPLFTFNLPVPSRIQAQESDLIALPQTTLMTDDDQESCSEPLPFSTPGPGSLLGSSVDSNTAFSLHVSRSPELYTNQTHIGPNPPWNRSHTPLYSSDSLFSDPSISHDAFFEKIVMDEVGLSRNPSMSKEDHRSLFSNIYSTPGPRFCAPVDFDSPLEDPIGSDPLQPGYEIDYKALDFQWKPFDRKNLVAPDRSHKPIYASGPAHSTGASDASGCGLTCGVEPIEAENNALIPHASVSPLLSTSPTPFRFLLPPESDASIPEYPFRNTVQRLSTPRKPPYFAVPGIFISPLDERRKLYDIATTKKHRIDSAVHRNNGAGNSVEQANSEASSDSIESWEDL